MKDWTNNRKGFVSVGGILAAVVLIVLVVVLSSTIFPILTSSDISRLESQGYIVLADGEYSDIMTLLDSIDTKADAAVIAAEAAAILASEVYDATNHISVIFPDDTNKTCTLIAGQVANTWSSWTEIVDNNATTLSSKFAVADGHITEIGIESLSDVDTVYMIEISYGASKTLITSGRFAGSTKFDSPSDHLRFWAPKCPAGETIYCRMKTGTAIADTALIHFRYHTH